MYTRRQVAGRMRRITLQQMRQITLQVTLKICLKMPLSHRLKDLGKVSARQLHLITFTLPFRGVMQKSPMIRHLDSGIAISPDL